MSTLVGSIQNGCYVLRDLGTGATATVDLVEVGRAMQARGASIPEETFEVLPHLGNYQVSGRIWNAIKKGSKKAAKTIKRGAKKVLRGAKKVAKTRIVKNAWKSAKEMPAPYGTYFQAADTAYKFGKALVPPKKNASARARSNHVKARKALPIVRALADRRISVQNAVSKAQQLGLKGSTVKKTALAMRMKKGGPPSARKALHVASKINALTKPSLSQRTITAPSGRSYSITVKAA